MDKLFYIVCEEKGATLFEGRCQGKTRGAAIKFLKERIGRPTLAGTVFTITEIPVPIIREIVREMLGGAPVTAPTVGEPATCVSPETAGDESRIIALPPQAPPTDGVSVPEKPERFDAFEAQNMHPVEEHELDGKPAEVAPATDGETDWNAARKFYQKCRSPKKVADRFRVPIDTIKSLVRRWKR